MGALADLRSEVADALGRACAGTSWSVYALPIESPSPPCYLLLWADPWLEPRTHCTFAAQLSIRVIGPRIEPDTGLEMLERMVEAAAPELENAKHPIRSVSAPGPYTINNVAYQSAVITLVDNANIGGQ